MEGTFSSGMHGLRCLTMMWGYVDDGSALSEAPRLVACYRRYTTVTESAGNAVEKTRSARDSGGEEAPD